MTVTANEAYLARILAPFAPQLPIDKLVFEVNKLYHDAEAAQYDETHPEIREQLPAVWAEMIRHAGLPKVPRPLDILDFGCGTGFEAQQLLDLLPSAAIGSLTCYDPSAAMVERCRAKISKLPLSVTFTALSSDLAGQRYDLLVTNSLLHHLPRPIQTLHDLAALLRPGAYWLAGHEPSSRFYRNAECVKALEEYQAEQRWKRFFRWEAYRARLARRFGIRTNPALEAARKSVEVGLFLRTPDVHAVNRLVDYYVAHSTHEACADRGFDFEKLQRELADEWELIWVKTYSFMGPVYERRLTTQWRERAHELSVRFPSDGANFASVWRKR